MAVSDIYYADHQKERSAHQQKQQRRSLDGTTKRQSQNQHQNEIDRMAISKTKIPSCQENYLSSSSSSSTTSSSDQNDKNILYINIRIQNVSEAVKERVTKKLERAVVIPNAVIDRAAQRASNNVAPKSVAETLSQILCKIFPKELEKKGIQAIVEEVFRESSFVVLQLRVQHVDPITLAASWFSGGGISWFLQTIGADNRKYFEDDYLPTMLTTLLVDYIPQLLEERMVDKKIEAETKVLKAEDQAPYFFGKLAQVRQEEKSGGGTLKKFRRAFSNMTVSSDRSSSVASGQQQQRNSSTLVPNYDVIVDGGGGDCDSVGSLSRTSSTFSRSSTFGSL
mmetsp:Transcript_48733/g.117896  ORF Transcript_48733/g.117896 Transcript_48733/m.117896 type:complete len:338 (-) Transcript_48733:204-1217(-)